MATTHRYNTNIGSDDRSVQSATKFWAIVFVLIFALGAIMLASFFVSDSGKSPTTQPAAERAAPGP
jgi:hypothetical protein